MTKHHKEKKKTVVNEEELQQKYMQLQIMKQQATSFMEEKQKLDASLNELNVTMDALKKLKETKSGETIWPSIGSSAFVTGSINDVKNVMVGVGAGVVVKKDLPTAIKLIDSRMKEAQKVDTELMEELTKIATAIQRLEPEVEEMVRSMQEQGKI